MKIFRPSIAALALASSTALAQPMNEGAMIEAQKEALAPLAWMDGHWRGTAKVMTPEGEIVLIQTERVGPLLGGAVRVVEGRGYDPETGETEFNALATLTYNPANGETRLNSVAQGRVGSFPLEIVENGFNWTIENGPATIRYETRQIDGQWVEKGTVSMNGGEPFQIFEMTLDRIGDSDWPSVGAVPLED